MKFIVLKVILILFITQINNYKANAQDSLAKAKALFTSGIKLSETDKQDEAIKEFTKSIELNPNDAETYNARGMAKNKLQDLNGALQDFTKAIELNPNLANAYYNRGALFFNLQEDHYAVRDYSKAVEIDPNYKEAWNNMGLVKLVIMNDLHKAEKHEEADKFYAEGCADIKKAASLGLDLAKENITKFCQPQKK